MSDFSKKDVIGERASEREQAINWTLIGASRGLGSAFFNELLKTNPKSRNIGLFSRKPSSHENHIPSAEPKVHSHAVDLSKPSEQERLIALLSQQKSPFRLVYFAGGGPFGPFEKKAFKDHEWAWQVNFVAASRILHAAFQWIHLQQICFIGSSVAESHSEPRSLSYATAKRALSGLVKEIQGLDPQFDLRLYSPGYMNTALLPPRSWPRLQNDKKLWEPGDVAADLLGWLNQVEERHGVKQLSMFKTTQGLDHDGESE